jgi:hypothetical protein
MLSSSRRERMIERSPMAILAQRSQAQKLLNNEGTRKESSTYLSI